MSSNFEILIIDGDRYLANIYKELFEKKDFKVYTADNGEQGVKVALNKIPNFILTEITLEKKSGLKLAEELKSNGKTKHIPIIAFSELGELGDVREAKKVGIHDYLIKSHNSKEEVLNYVKEFTN